jgi:heptosyltransferase-2
VVAPNWIGDALMAQPLLGKLRARLQAEGPEGRIDVLAPPWVAPVIKRMAEVDEVIQADLSHGVLQLRERWRLGRRLKERGYDQAIVLPNSWKSALTPFFADIPLRSGYVGEFRYGLLNSNYRNNGSGAMAAHYARLSEPPGREMREPLPEPRLRIAPDEVEATRRKFRVPERYAVFCPGAEYGPAKRWPHYGGLAERLDLPVLLLGSAKEREQCLYIPGHNLAGETTLDEAIDLIAGAAYVVTNDSGLMHVAAALGTPQVALFGSSSPERTPPLSSRARVVWLRPECSPCFERVCPLGHFKCLNELTVEQVLAEIRRLP